MTRFITLLSVALISICCTGCGDAGAPLVSAQQSAPPKPVPPPSGEPAEKPVKPGSEVPAQFGGRQFVLLIGRPPITGNAAPGVNGASGDSSASDGNATGHGNPDSCRPDTARKHKPSAGCIGPHDRRQPTSNPRCLSADDRHGPSGR